MGKKKSSGNGGGGGGENGGGEEVAREFVLKVAMHCRCHGCTDKVRGALRDITLERGVEAADSSAAESSGEVRLLATADPERLRRRLRRATGKKVDLLLPREPPAGKDQGAGGGKKGADPLADPAFQALLANLQLQAQAQAQAAPARQQYGGAHGAAWAANHQQLMALGLGMDGGVWNGGAAAGYGAAYPCPASSYYPAAPAGPWGAYAYPPPPAPAPAHGYYGGAAPGWHGY